MKWDAQLYDQKHAFVSKFGEELVDVLQPLPGERVLDLGCGTGDLAGLISSRGADVTGIDNSAEMIERAKAKFPALDFRVANAETMNFDQEFSAVFSSAVLHWIKDQRAVIEGVYKALRPGGRYIAEMGGKGNVGRVITSLRKVLEEYGYVSQAETRLWFYPSIGEYTTMLERAGFRVTYAVHFDRDTLLQDQERGVGKWLKMFCVPFFEGVAEEHKDQMIEKIIKMTEPYYCRDGEWYADYKRLRFIAIKEN